MKVSVAMSTFNAGAFLSKQLSSLAAQTRLPDELVVRDDGSTDATFDLLEAYARDAPFAVHLDRGEQLGSTQSFASAIARCSGEIVVLADQDDEWFPAKIARLSRSFEEDDRMLMACSDAHMVDEAGRVISYSTWDTLGFVGPARDQRGLPLLRFLLGRAVVAGCTLAFRADARAVLLPLPGELENQDEAMHHDRWISLALAATGQVAIVEEPLLAYRIHRGQQIGISMLRLRGVIPVRLWGLAGLATSHEQRRRQLTARLRQFSLLVERLREHGFASPAAVDEIVAYCRHLERRAAFPSSRRRRIPLVVREWRLGEYGRYGFGASTALADLAR
jgi:glycosyltransferase involved in cell wall biosynthesis